ncbi:unnamed protein product [Linum trigynum]|uniref:Exocyst complex subunit Exo70 C-terminal domain-containing protein n=1 Tax=Linum trigynum TaxID=586398 RepID=A0AAV2FPE4_9ROSI
MQKEEGYFFFLLERRLEFPDAAVEEVYGNQSSWVVPDSRLRDEIKISVARKRTVGFTSDVGRVEHSGSGK